MSGLIQIITGFLGTLGFNILFNIRGRKLLFATLGGLISWSVFLALQPLFPGEVIRYLLSAAVVTLYGEVLARLEKTPTTTFLVPSVIPLIPGGALYYTMNYALNKQWSQFAHQAFYTLQLALSLAVGIIAVTTTVRLLTGFLAWRKSRERSQHFHHSIR
jgi:uncharacterized membrane protein YjjB (DUF3815 family)